MRVGIITITGMPAWGGAEIYFDRLNNFLNSNGHDSCIYSAVPEMGGYDNGSGNYTRLVLPHIQQGIEEHGLKHGGGIIFNELNELEIHTNAWLDMLENQLATEPKKDIGIIYLQTLFPKNISTVLDRLKPYFGALITTSFDVESDYIIELTRCNMQNPSLTLLETFNKVKHSLIEKVGHPEEYNLMRKQNIPEVNHHLHLCHFHQEIMQYLKPSTGEDFVLHPLMGQKWYNGIDYGNHYQPIVENPSDYTIGVINPIEKKGKGIIAKIIARTPYNFLILQGGWGDGEKFVDYLKEEYGTDFSHRVRLGDYSQDIVGYFDNIDAFLFPSWIEGYGQVGHESLLRRTPVITSDYPAIHQATIGKGKYVPLTQYHNIDLWVEALEDVFKNQAYWHFECNDAALMLMNRTQFNGNDFLTYLTRITDQLEKENLDKAKLIDRDGNLLED